MSLTDVQTFFEKQAAQWDYSSDKRKLEKIRFFFRRYFAEISAPVLDLGCGTGVLLKIFPEFLTDTHSLILELDLSRGMLRQVFEKARHLKQRVVPIQADGHHLPLTDRSMATVVAFQVFPHFINPRLVLQEVYRVLRPRGKFLILHLMNHEQLNSLHRQADEAVADHYLPAVEELVPQIRQVGFKVEHFIEQEDCYLISARREAPNSGLIFSH